MKVETRQNCYYFTLCYSMHHALTVFWQTKFVDPCLMKRVVLGRQLHKLPRCIRFIDGTLVDIYRQWKNSKHRSCFNGWNQIFAMNNTMVLNHHGLFIYINMSYFRFYHNINILHLSTIYWKWCHYFTYGG